jgi:muconolactone delta-isomerase
MLFFVRVDIHQPESMSTHELLSVWLEEARAALEAKEAGVVLGVWKVAGQRTVLSICDFPDHKTLDRGIAGLPLVRSLGGAVVTEALPLRAYEDFVRDLERAVGG